MYVSSRKSTPEGVQEVNEYKFGIRESRQRQVRERDYEVGGWYSIVQEEVKRTR